MRLAIKCKCPRCAKGNLYKSRFSTEVVPVCPECGLELAGHDSGDGPAVFLIFILGFSLVPLALLVEKFFHPPLWFHGVFWTFVALAIVMGTLKPLKAYVIALEYKHRPGDWKKNDDS